MSMVVESLISILVEKALSDVIAFLDSRIQRKRKLIAVMNRWKTTLEVLNGVLSDADSKKQSNPAVRKWLNDLEDLMYDVEDAIEMLNYQALQRQLEPSLWSKMKTGLIWHNSEVDGKLKEITQRFQLLKDAIADFNLLVTAASSIMLQPSRQTREPSSSVPPELKIFGRDYYKQKIIQILKEESESRIGVVSIFGMGGLGKTTLARYVYNDIKSHFDVSAWVCVSADYNTERITKDILESISGNCGDVKDKALDWIQNRLRQELRNKKFLLVLDDNWNEDYGDWQILMAPFNEGLSGSKIIVTTRSKNIALKVSPAASCIEPNFLSALDCWSLLCIHAKLDPNETSIFEKTGKNIAEKCCGLPLAVMTVGGMLRDKLRVEEWEDIQNNMTRVSKDVMPVLKMSYDDLTPQLKRCFAFFSLLPGDYKFKEEEVVLLWIGAGLIVPLDREKSKKKVAHDCFYKLLSRSLFSRMEDGGWYMMHDLLRELAIQVSLGKTLHIDKDDNELMIKSVRHLGFYDPARFLRSCRKATSLPLRTVLQLDDGPYYYRLLECPKQIGEMFLRLKYIRVLALTHLQTATLPESIGQMKLLRYLNLSKSVIQMLPTSLTTLYYLEILILRNCNSLKQLPEKIHKLIRLWYLDITRCESLKKLPGGIKELTRLEMLPCFIVDENLSIASMGNMKHLQGSLNISCLQKVASPEDAALAQLSEKRLDRLELSWSESDSLSDDPIKREKQIQVLESLQPHKDLKELRIVNGNGQMFPSWLNNSFGCLTYLKLEDCHFNHSALFTPNNLVSLEYIFIIFCANMEVCLSEMPNLKRLTLLHCSYVRCTETFNAAKLDDLHLSTVAMSDLFKDNVKLGFPNIRSLQIGALDCSFADIVANNYDEEIKVEELCVAQESSIEHLPQWVSKAKFLKQIEVKNCSSLKKLLPNGDIPPSLKRIRICDCPQLTSILSQDPLPETANSLRRIFVSRCSSLKVLLLAEIMEINDCMSLESFHERGSQSHSIRWLSIKNCPLLSQKLRDRDEQLCSKLTLDAGIVVDGDEFHLT